MNPGSLIFEPIGLTFEPMGYNLKHNRLKFKHIWFNFEHQGLPIWLTFEQRKEEAEKRGREVVEILAPRVYMVFRRLPVQSLNEDLEKNN